MTDKIITYETVYETLRKEKFKNDLQQLEETFFNDVVKYLEERKKSLLSSES